MDDLVKVKIVHAAGDAHGPVHKKGGRDLPACSQDLVQLPLGAVLHDDAVTRRLGANTPENTRIRRQLSTKAEPLGGGHISHTLARTNLKVMMLGCFSLRKCLMSVSLMFRTFLTATSCPCSLPRKTAP